MSTSKRVTVTEIIDAVDNDEWLLSEDELEDDEFEDHSVLLPTSDYCKKRKMTLKVTPMTPFRLRLITTTSSIKPTANTN